MIDFSLVFATHLQWDPCSTSIENHIQWISYESDYANDPL